MYYMVYKLYYKIYHTRSLLMNIEYICEKINYNYLFLYKK